MSESRSLLSLLTVVITAGCVAASADDGVAQFESKVRPLLLARCVKCHGADKHEANLRLDVADGARQGGDSGPAVVPKKPQESLLIQAVRHEKGLKMPPDGKLSEKQIADLVEWVKGGAVWPGDSGAARPAGRKTPS